MMGPLTHLSIIWPIASTQLLARPQALNAAFIPDKLRNSRQCKTTSKTSSHTLQPKKASYPNCFKAKVFQHVFEESLINKTVNQVLILFMLGSWFFPSPKRHFDPPNDTWKSFGGSLVLKKLPTILEGNMLGCKVHHFKCMKYHKLWLTMAPKEKSWTNFGLRNRSYQLCMYVLPMIHPSKMEHMSLFSMFSLNQAPLLATRCLINPTSMPVQQ